MLATIWMAAHTVVEILNPFFAVFVLHLATAVFVTTVAGVTIQAIGMALRAGTSATFTVVDREPVV
jgi:hypothetical protein